MQLFCLFRFLFRYLRCSLSGRNFLCIGAVRPFSAGRFIRACKVTVLTSRCFRSIRFICISFVLCNRSHCKSFPAPFCHSHNAMLRQNIPGLRCIFLIFFNLIACHCRFFFLHCGNTGFYISAKSLRILLGFPVMRNRYFRKFLFRKHRSLFPRRRFRIILMRSNDTGNRPQDNRFLLFRIRLYQRRPFFLIMIRHALHRNMILRFCLVRPWIVRSRLSGIFVFVQCLLPETQNLFKGGRLAYILIIFREFFIIIYIHCTGFSSVLVRGTKNRLPRLSGYRFMLLFHIMFNIPSFSPGLPDILNRIPGFFGQCRQR